MLNLFVENFPIIFGEDSVSYNVHSVLHVSETVKQTGDPIAGFSYAFENYLQVLKNSVRKPTKIWEQINRKIVQEQFIAPTISEFPIIKGNKCIFRNLLLSSDFPNKYCYIKTNIPICIQSFSKNSDIVSIIGCKFNNISPFFVEPINSLSLGIYFADLNKFLWFRIKGCRVTTQGGIVANAVASLLWILIIK